MANSLCAMRMPLASSITRQNRVAVEWRDSEWPNFDQVADEVLDKHLEFEGLGTSSR
jgi:hypothetical protein